MKIKLHDKYTEILMKINPRYDCTSSWQESVFVPERAVDFMLDDIYLKLEKLTELQKNPVIDEDMISREETKPRVLDDNELALLKRGLADVFNKNGIDAILNLSDYRIAELVINHLDILAKNPVTEEKSERATCRWR